MTADDLRTRLDSLAFPERAALLAREAAALTGAEVERLCAELAAPGDPASRELALRLARHGRCLPALRAALADPDGEIRAGAARALPSCAGVRGEEALDAYRAGSARERRALTRGILAARRPDLAAAVLPAARERARAGDLTRLLRALPAGEAVERTLAESPLASLGAEALAGAHPLAVLRAAEAELSALPAALRGGWWDRLSPAIARAIRLDPSSAPRALSMLTRFPPRRGLTHEHSALYSALLRSDAAVAAPLLAPLLSARAWLAPVPSGAASRALVAAAAEAIPASASHDAETPAAPGGALGPLLALARANPSALERALGAAHPVHARAVAGALEELLPGLGRENPGVDAHLPRRMRHRDAALALGQADPTQPAEPAAAAAAARLDVPAARERLEPLLASPIPETRALGYERLIGSAALARSAPGLASVLARSPGLGREREPVRARALEALCRVPARVFAGVDPAALARLAAETSGAADLSPRSERSLAELGWAILGDRGAGSARENPAWLSLAVRLVADGAEATGVLEVSRASAADSELLAAAMLPALRRRARSGDWGPPTRFIGALVRRDPELRLLAEREASPESIDLLLADPVGRARTARDLASLPGALESPRLRAEIARSLTDLLPLLARPVEEHPIDPLGPAPADPRASRRWTGAQRARLAADYEARLRAVGVVPPGSDPLEVEFSGVERVLRALAALPGHGCEVLRSLAAPAARGESPAADAAPRAQDASVGHADSDADSASVDHADGDAVSRRRLRALAIALLGRRTEDACGDDLLLAALLERGGADGGGAGVALARRARVLRPSDLGVLIDGALAGDPGVSARRALIAAIAAADPENLWTLVRAVLAGSGHRDVLWAARSLALRRGDAPAALSGLEDGLDAPEATAPDPRLPALLSGVEATTLSPARRSALGDALATVLEHPGEGRDAALAAAPAWVGFSAALRDALWRVNAPGGAAVQAASAPSVGPLLEAGLAGGLAETLLGLAREAAPAAPDAREGAATDAENTADAVERLRAAAGAEDRLEHLADPARWDLAGVLPAASRAELESAVRGLLSLGLIRVPVRLAAAVLVHGAGPAERDTALLSEALGSDPVGAEGLGELLVSLDLETPSADATLRAAARELAGGSRAAQLAAVEIGGALGERDGWERVAPETAALLLLLRALPDPAIRERARALRPPGLAR